MQGLPGVGADSDHGFRGRTRLRDPGFETASSVAGTRRVYASGVVVMVLANVQFDCWRKARSSSIATGSDTQHDPVSYTHLRAHETDSYLVCRLLLEKKKK